MRSKPKQLDLDLENTHAHLREKLMEANMLLQELSAWMKAARQDPREPHRRDRGNSLYKRSLRYLGRAA